MTQINVAVVGLGFGASFAQIYRKHPNVGTLGIYDPDPEAVRKLTEKIRVDKVYNSFEEVLADGRVDAVHILTPIPLHEEQTVRVLESGKHCACAVPMATSLEGIRAITEAARRSGKNYMMMETTLYTYQFFYVRQLLRSGELGRIQFLRGSHYQDLENWPGYWVGLPPMFYGTHAVSPMRVLAEAPITRVHGFGSGVMGREKVAQYGNPYPVETAIFEFENGLKGEATRSLFETARAYQEGMFVYGSKTSFEWGFSDGDAPYLETLLPAVPGWRGRDVKTERVSLPNYYEDLPEEIQPFTVGGNFDPLNPRESLKKGAGGAHYGSHPHLAHEFVQSIIENRRPWIDESLAGNITAACVCAHLSAMRGGEGMDVPVF